MKPSDVALNPTPLGYTVSLLIYLVPVLALYRWFRRCCPEGGGLFRRAAVPAAQGRVAASITGAAPFAGRF